MAWSAALIRVMREPPITTVATVLAIRHEHLFDASLPNGKLVIAHVPKWLQKKMGPVEVGSRIKLELTPYDFSTARVAGLAEAS